MRTILITGTTSGIGLELARQYDQQGARLILIGRRPLSSLSDPIFSENTYCQADLSQPDCHLTIERWLKDKQISSIDLLIHNAGIGWVGEPQEHLPADIVEMIQVNLKAPIAITHQLFSLIEKVSGKIVFVSSVVSQLPLHKFAVYTASKAALDGFARSLAVETQGGIGVQVLHPGATNTAMHAKIGAEEAVYSKYPSANNVAAKMVKAIRRNKRHVAIGLGNKFLRRLSLTAPLLLEKMMRQKTQSGSNNNHEAHIIITGGADGIGAAAARRYSAAGQRVTILDIDSGRGDALAQELGKSAEFRQLDLANLESIEGITDQISALPTVTTLINNAGISAAGPFDKLGLSEMLSVIDINLTGALILTTSLLRKNRLANGHQQIYLSSLSKYVGYPGAAVYSASKDGLAAFAKTMQTAAVANGRVTTVFPGPTRTAHARRYSPDNSREEKRMSPEAVAEAIYQGASNKRRLVFPGAGAKLFAIFGRLLPRAAEMAMKKTIYDKL